MQALSILPESPMIAAEPAPLISLDLDPDQRSTVTARAALEALPEPDAPDARDDLALLVTELVTNSARHAGRGPGQRIDLRVIERGPELRVEVRDSGDGFDPDPRDPGPAATGGRGLLILDRLSRRWGVDCAQGTCVWFELDWMGSRAA